MTLAHRRFGTFGLPFIRNPFHFKPKGRARGRRSLYLEFLEERVLLSAQTVSDISETVRHNTLTTFNLVDFTNAFTDTNGGSLTEIEFTTLPVNGTLALSGVSITIDQVINTTDLANLTYSPDPDYIGSDVIGWNGSDGVSFADDPANININVEDALPTVGNVVKFVATNTATAFQASDFNSGFTDPDLGDNNVPQAIQITSLPTQGTLLFSGSPVTVGQAIFIGQISNLVYTPPANFTGSDSFGWNASDGNELAATSADVNVIIQAAPTVSNITEVAHHNTALSINLSDFNNAFADTSGGTLTQIEFTSLPTNGTLELNGVMVTVDQVISTADVPNLSYIPNSNYTGPDVIGWNGSDGDLSAAAAANINIDVQESPPTIGNVNKFISPNTMTGFFAPDFSAGFSDPDAGDTLQQVQITSLPAQGTLLFAGNPVSVGLTIDSDQITLLSYTPNTDYTGSDSFGWNGSDGSDFAGTGADVNISVSSTPIALDINENGHHNTTLNFTASNFTTAFLDATGASLAQVQIVTLPSVGTLSFEGQAVTQNQIINISDISNLSYVPGFNATGIDSFTWIGTDGTTSAGAPANVNIDVQESAPVLADVSKTAAKNASTTFAISDFSQGFTDPDTGDIIQSIKITSLPTVGTLKLNSVDVTAGQILSIDQITNLTYVAVPGYLGADSFGWNASDGLLFATAAANVDITVSDTAPTISAINLSTKQNTSITLGTAVFTGAFADADAGDALVNVGITVLPTFGSLKLAGVPIILDQIIPLNQLSKLVYTPESGFAGSESISWSASDGEQFASSPTSLTIHVAGKAPTVAPITKGVVENSTTFTFSSWDFTDAFTDPNLGPILHSITVTSLPAHGTLILSGTAPTDITAGQVIAADQIDTLSYLPDADYTGTDSFGWNGSDGINSAAKASTVTFTVVSNAGLVLTGGGNVIVAGTKSTSQVNLTNFGQIGTFSNLDGNAVTRTYTLTNNSAAVITFTGGAHLIQISGSDPGDFSVSALTDTVTNGTISALTPGESANFTITFEARGSGSRTATVKVPVSSGAAFTFAIGGTGVKTLNDTNTSSSIFGLQFLTTQKGSGTAAQVGDVLTMNYTGYLLDGTIFDSSLNPDRTPFQFALIADLGEQPQVITGWDPGLEGIKVGETRTLILPSSLAYGTTGSGPIPANATLVFVVQCLAIGVPRVGAGVEGNNTSITPQSTKPSVSEGTNFGTLSATQSSLTVTFDLFSVGYQSGTSTDGSGNPIATEPFFTAQNPIVISSSDAADFVLASSGGTFTVKFVKPNDTKVHTAKITVFTDDPINPSFFFTIQASAASFVDLSATLGTTHLPAATITSGDQTNLAIPVTLKNLGNTTTSGKTDIQIFALNTSTQTQTLITTLANQNLGGIGSNKTKSMTLDATLPVGLVAGTYELVAVFNPSQSIVESGYTNNTVTTTQTINVTQGLADLTGTLVSTTFPPTVVSNATLNSSVTLLVTNQGNVPLPANQQVTVQIFAHDTNTNQDTLLTTSAPLSVASLKSGASDKFTILVKNTTGLPTDTYVLEAQINPVQALAESNTDNNLVAFNASAQQFTVVATNSFFNLTGTLASSTLPATRLHDTSLSGTVNVTVVNAGNLVLPAHQQIQLELFLHPDSGSNVTLKVTTISLASWAPGTSKTFALSGSLPGGLPAGDYILEAAISPSPALAESNPDDNFVTLNNSGSTIPLIIT